jgi:hypothetical protein
VLDGVTLFSLNHLKVGGLKKNDGVIGYFRLTKHSCEVFSFRCSRFDALQVSAVTSRFDSQVLWCIYSAILSTRWAAMQQHLWLMLALRYSTSFRTVIPAVLSVFDVSQLRCLIQCPFPSTHYCALVYFPWLSNRRLPNVSLLVYQLLKCIANSVWNVRRYSAVTYSDCAPILHLYIYTLRYALNPPTQPDRHDNVFSMIRPNVYLTHKTPVTLGHFHKILLTLSIKRRVLYRSWSPKLPSLAFGR